MPELQYKEALKLAQKEYRSCVSRGLYPYLPVLDELLTVDQLTHGRDLGLVQIPLEHVVGTRSSARSNTFARNFMPLAPERSEFADKWNALCRSHLEEGIRDPIKVYEYMNRFYVEEGNKRVSVLRYFDAVNITARVIRVLPEPSDAKEVRLYYEFVDFYRLSRINFLELSRLGGFAQLQQLMGKGPEELWTEEDRSAFATTYHYFRQAYEACGGKRLKSTVGDAMLAYMEVYGYAALRGRNASELKQALSKIWEDITLQQEDEPIDVKLNPEDKKQGILSKVLSGGDNKLLKVAFVHDRNSENSGWTRGHERGRQYVQQVMAGQIETSAYCDALASDPQEVLEQAVADGNTTIFTTSARLLPAALKVAIDHPNVTIFNCSLNQSHRYIRTYYARMYEVKFIIGAIAGSLAGENPIGYLCDYPIYGQIAGINAFALGVQMVNPRTKVYLSWSSVGGSDAALKRLTDQGIRLISSQDLVRQGDEWRSLGLSLITEGNQTNLAMPLWQWGTYYEEMLRRIRNRTVETEYQESSKALNYYWGLSAGTVDLRCSDNIPPATRKMAELLKNSIRMGICNPFHGPLYTQSGKVLENDQLLTPEQIIAMDYLVENVVGEIPEYEELSEMGKATVDMVGVKPATRDKRS